MRCGAVRRLAKLETVMEDDTVSVDMDVDRGFLAQSIDEAVQRLSPGARAVFVLHDVEGYTHEEIATELGITAGGSKVAALQGTREASPVARASRGRILTGEGPDTCHTFRLTDSRRSPTTRPRRTRRRISPAAGTAAPRWRPIAGSRA
jgi:hypothetical protein